MKTRILIAALVAFLMCGCNPKSDCEKLQGEWHLHSMGRDFRFFPESTKGGFSRIIFGDGEFTIQEDQGETGILK